MASRDTHATAIRAQIKAGYVLHIDPDYLLLTYGERCVMGPLTPGIIGPRYAMCIGVDTKGEATFWALLTSQDGIHVQAIPESAKVGAWAGNARQSYFAKDQVWVITREMAIDAHLQANSVKSTFKHSYVKADQITPWPATPTTYPLAFTPIDRIRPEDRSVVKDPVPAPEFVEGLFDWRTWMGEQRRAKQMSTCALVDAMAIPSVTVGVLMTVEGGETLFSVPELVAWVKALGLEGDVHLRQIPVLTDEEAAEREVPCPEEEAVVPVAGPTPAPIPERIAITDKALKLLTNHRLTDEEVHHLVQRLEQAAISILLGA